MKHFYHCPKKLFSKDEIEKTYLFFKNGDYLEIRKNELIDVQISLYDELIQTPKGFSPRGAAGTVRLRIRGGKPRHEAYALCDPEEYRKDRKAYIETRAVKDGGISHVIFFDANYWNDTVYGDLYAEMDGNDLCLRFHPGAKVPADSPLHTVALGSPDRKKILQLCLDFENCDEITFYGEEILDLSLRLDDELCRDSGAYTRQVVGGSIKLRPLKEYASCRHARIIGQKNPKTKDLIKRIGGKNWEELDVCRLFITYDYPGYGMFTKETIEVSDLRCRKGAPPRKTFEEEEWYISGYAKAEKGGTVLLSFDAVKPD